MDGQEKLLDYETIKAAVAGEKWATEKVLAHYADYIDELSTVEIRQPGGKVKKVIDEDMRQHISLKLLEALPSFQLEQEERSRGLHPLTPLCGYHLHTPETDTPAARLYLFRGLIMTVTYAFRG